MKGQGAVASDHGHLYRHRDQEKLFVASPKEEPRRTWEGRDTGFLSGGAAGFALGAPSFPCPCHTVALDPRLLAVVAAVKSPDPIGASCPLAPFFLQGFLSGFLPLELVLVLVPICLVTLGTLGGVTEHKAGHCSRAENAP